MSRISVFYLTMVVMTVSVYAANQRDKGMRSNGVAESNEGMECKLVKRLANGHLGMLPWNEPGDLIPDFSYCGYRNNGVNGNHLSFYNEEDL